MKVIVVDDEKNIRDTIVKYLKLENITGIPAGNGLSAKRILEEEVVDIAVVDLKMPGMDGLQLLKWINDFGQDIPVIIISAFGEIKDAVESMKLGAKDYIVKPFDPEELVIKIKNIYETKVLKDKVETGKKNDFITDSFIGENKKILEIKNLIKKIADTDSTILITGESGTGKEVVARNIHKLSVRADCPFVAINIGGIPENLLESELFGYEKGAFTGANMRKKGMFEVASTGTLFLDEIGDMPLSLQVKLLRVLQDKKIQRLGSTQDIPIDVRIISATNKNLDDLIKIGSFREDLFFRLNVIKVELPALRDRVDDIPLLIGAFIKKLNKKLNKNIKDITKEAIESIKSYNFPGNIRELENILERAFILADNNIINESNLGLTNINKKNNLNKGKFKDIEKDAIIKALHRWDGNRTKAANELGVSRRTIINKIKEYNLKEFL